VAIGPSGLGWSCEAPTPDRRGTDDRGQTATGRATGEERGDPDFLRSVAEAVLQLLMEADVEGLIGAARHGRTGESG
jgi:transposase-like protein